MGCRCGRVRQFPAELPFMIRAMLTIVSCRPPRDRSGRHGPYCFCGLAPSGLEGEQRTFSIPPPAILTNDTRVADNAVARNLNGDVILSNRRSNGTCRIAAADCLRQLAVADDLSIWNPQQSSPDSKLKWTAANKASECSMRRRWRGGGERVGDKTVRDGVVPIDVGMRPIDANGTLCPAMV